MKKLLLIFAAFLFAFTVTAQTGLYFGAAGGVRNNYTYNYGKVITRNTNAPTLKGVVEVFAGYTFTRGKVSVETGLSKYQLINRVDTSTPTKPLKNYPELAVNYDAWQIPVRLKVIFWKPVPSLSIRALVGAGFVLSNPDKFEVETEYGIEEVSSNVYRLTDINDGINGQGYDFIISSNSSSSYTNLTYEAGMEVVYSVTQKLEITSSAMYVAGAQVHNITNLYRDYNRNGFSTTQHTSTSISKGDALVFKAGVRFYPGWLKPKEKQNI